MWLKKHLTLAKNNNGNYCTQCEGRYNTLGNRPGSCQKGADSLCIAQYDWSKDEDVLKCEI